MLGFSLVGLFTIMIQNRLGEIVEKCFDPNVQYRERKLDIMSTISFTAILLSALVVFPNHCFRFFSKGILFHTQTSISLKFKFNHTQYLHLFICFLNLVFCCRLKEACSILSLANIPIAIKKAAIVGSNFNLFSSLPISLKNLNQEEIALVIKRRADTTMNLM